MAASGSVMKMAIIMKEKRNINNARAVRQRACALRRASAAKNGTIENENKSNQKRQKRSGMAAKKKHGEMAYRQ
jgi:precorrin-2 methylase